MGGALVDGIVFTLLCWAIFMPESFGKWLGKIWRAAKGKS